MALDFYDNRNKRTDVPLHFEYSMEQVGQYSERAVLGGSFFWWRVTRRARKTYSYVGLSKAAARRCADEKKLYYTRPFVFWGEHKGVYVFRHWGVFSRSNRNIPIGNADKYFDCVAEINVTRMDGELYTVQITVDETVVIYKHLYGVIRTLPPKDQFERWFADKNYSWAHTYGYDE